MTTRGCHTRLTRKAKGPSKGPCWSMQFLHVVPWPEVWNSEIIQWRERGIVTFCFLGPTFKERETTLKDQMSYEELIVNVKEMVSGAQYFAPDLQNSRSIQCSKTVQQIQHAVKKYRLTSASFKSHSKMPTGLMGQDWLNLVSIIFTDTSCKTPHTILSLFLLYCSCCLLQERSNHCLNEHTKFSPQQARCFPLRFIKLSWVLIAVST